jgi:hypothetical protein
MKATDVVPFFPVLTAAAGWVVVCFVGLFGLIFLYRIARNQIDISSLISEPTGDASLSRLQFLIFTFVIAMSLFLVVAAQGKFSDVPPTVTALLGISGGSYLVSKGIQFSNPAGVTDARPTLVLSTPAGQLAPGASFNLAVSMLNTPAGTPTPPLTWSLDAPAHGTIIPGPGGATYTAPTPSAGAGTKITIRLQATGFEDGVSVITLA